VPSLAIVATVACLIGLFTLAFDWRQAIINTLVGALVMMSLVALTGFVGQISLAQMAIAGTAGFAVSKFLSSWPFPLGPIVGALVATAFGLLVAIPALRVRGVNLAVVTFAAAVAIEELVFKNAKFAGELGALEVKPPTIFGQRVGPNNQTLAIFGAQGHDKNPPNVWFGVFCLVFVVIFALLMVNVRRSATGRRFLSVRSNERAAASAGVNVSGTKLLAFGLSAFIAGIGGVLSGYSLGSVTPLYFGSLASLTFLAFAYLGGISSVSGAIWAGFLVPVGISFTLLNKVFHISPNYTPLIGGLGLITTAILNPEGVAGGLRIAKQQIKALIAKRTSSPPSTNAARATVGGGA
jgi:branched-chain amino acid transport system permease protein